MKYLIWAFLFFVNGCGDDGATGNNGTDTTNTDTDSVAGEALPEAGYPAGLVEMDLEDPPPGAVYIDPENSDDANQDGSLEHPFESFDVLSMTEETTYAVKRGTTLNINELNLRNGITIMSYGNGDRPVLHSLLDPPEGVNKHAIVSGWGGIAHVIIRDVVVECPTATSCIRLGGSDLNNNNLQIINVATKGGTWGIRAFGTAGLRIHNTEVSQVLDDGMFLQANDGIEISNCYVHHVNLHWKAPQTPEAEAGGDAIQFDACNNWHVHHNQLDRSNSGNKFCFISNNADQDNGVFEYNTTFGPMTVSGGAAIYFHNGDGLIVRYNTVLAPASSALFSHATNLELYGNIVVGADSGFYTSASALVYNNTFYDVSQGLSGGEVEARNNIFVMRDNGAALKGVNALTESHNLLVNASDTAPNSFTGNPDFRDASARDFQLGDASDAVDAGTNLKLEEDMVGTAIPQGNGPDLGALEKKAP